MEGGTNDWLGRADKGGGLCPHLFPDCAHLPSFVLDPLRDCFQHSIVAVGRLSLAAPFNG